MHRIEGADYNEVDGVKLFQTGPPGTVVTHEWLNAIQEEIVSLILNSGQALKTEATESRDQLISSVLVGKYLYADASEGDQGVVATGSLKTLKDCIDEAGVDKATIVLVNSGAGTTYTVNTAAVVPSNVSIKPQRGAVFGGTGTLTFDNPAQILAPTNQQVFGSTIADSITFTNKGRLFPEWFGADPSAATDSETAINNALTSMVGGGILDANHRDFRADATLTLNNNITFEGYGGTIDFSNAPNGDYLFHVLGSQGAAQALTSNVLAGADNIPVAGAAGFFTAGDWTVVRDDEIWDQQNSTYNGEWVYIRNVNAASVDLGDTLLYAYYTVDSAKIDVMSLKENIFIRGVTATGSGSGGSQYGIITQWAKNVRIKDCVFNDFETNGIGLYRTINFKIESNTFTGNSPAANGYGIQVGGCANGLVAHNHVEYYRTGTDAGSSLMPSRFITFHKNTIRACRDYGMETHAMADHISITDNFIQSGNSDGTIQRGIRYSGVNATITGNTVIGTELEGIDHRPIVYNGDLPSFSHIKDNKVIRCGTAGNAAIYVSQETIYNNDTPFEGIQITGNYIEDPGTHGIFVYAPRANMSMVKVDNNTIKGVSAANTRCIWIYCLTGVTIKHGTVSGNMCERDDDLSDNILLQSIDAGGLSFFSLVGNTLKNGTYGINGSYCSYTSAIGNTCESMSNTGVVLQAASNNYDDTNSNLEG